MIEPKTYGAERFKLILEFGKTLGKELAIEVFDFKDYSSYSIFRYMGYKPEVFVEGVAEKFEETYQVELQYMEKYEKEFWDNI